MSTKTQIESWDDDIPALSPEDIIGDEISRVNTGDSPEMKTAMLGIENINYIWASIVFEDDREKRRIIAENFIDILYLLKWNQNGGLFCCKKCGNMFLGKRAGLCPRCVKEHKKELRAKREGTELFKAKRAAEHRIINRYGELSPEISSFRNEYEKKAETDPESELIKWVKGCYRTRAEKSNNKSTSRKK